MDYPKPLSATSHVERCLSSIPDNALIVQSIASILVEVHFPEAEAAQEAIAIYVATPVSERSPNNGLPKA